MVCWLKQQLRIIANRYKYEPNTKTVRESFTNDILAMLQEVKRTSGISEYGVVCDETNNNVQTIDNHELWCKVAIKPVAALEYIIIDIDVVGGKVGFGEGTVPVKD